MRKDAREIDQLVEQVEQAALLGAEPARQFTAAALAEPHELLVYDERLHDQDGVLFEQSGDFRANGGEAAVLDLDKLIFADGVDAKAGDALFHARRCAGVEGLELAME